MAVDILAASRRPLERLLHECSFSQWENIALFLDEGATEAVRWAGGLGFVLEELGISQILDLQVGLGCCLLLRLVVRDAQCVHLFGVLEIRSVPNTCSLDYTAAW